MANAISLDTDWDNTALKRVVRAGITLAVVQAVAVVFVSIITHLLGGFVEHALTGVVVYCGAMFTIFYPATITRPRTIEGIAGAAGVGLLATWVFVLIDALLLQTVHVYTNRWHQIGGGSIWWYLPVWWMVGTFLAWMGGWICANQSNRRGDQSVPSGITLVTITTAVCGLLAIVIRFPQASLNVPTFAIALLPGLAVAALVSSLGRKRG